MHLARVLPLIVLTSVLGGGGCGDDVVVESNIAYDDRFPSTRMDVYEPGAVAPGRPAVLVVHGGGWHEGLYRDGMADHADRLARAGYVAINVEYRLVPDRGSGRDPATTGVFPHAVQDCLCALAYVRAHADTYGIDPARIAALGYSAGGHLVSMLGTAATDPVVAPDCAAGPTGPVAAVVSGAGPEDMALLPQVETVIDFVGGSLADVPELYAAASPIDHVAAGAPPFLFVHGDRDWFVAPEHSTRMRAALEAVGTETHLLEIPGGGHLWNGGAGGGTWDLEMSIDTPEAWAAIIDFLDTTIGGRR